MTGKPLSGLAAQHQFEVVAVWSHKAKSPLNFALSHVPQFGKHGGFQHVNINSSIGGVDKRTAVMDVGLAGFRRERVVRLMDAGSEVCDKLHSCGR